MEDDLFGDFAVALLSTPKISTSSASAGPEKEIKAAWRLWSDLTERPDRTAVHRDFAKTYRDLLRANHRSAKLNEIIQGAARLSPNGRDAFDVKRVVSALTNANKTRLALAALREQKDIIPYPRPEIAQKCTLRELESALGTYAKEWIEVDQEAAGLLMERYDADEVQELADHAARILATDDVYPSEALRHAKTVGTLKVAFRGDRDNYQAGRTEADILKEVSLMADPAAKKMLHSGADARKVRDFHLLAPEGYWDDVLDAMDDDLDLSAEEAYDLVGPKHNGWHPSRRS